MAVQALRFVAYDGDDPNGAAVGELTESAGKFFDIEYNGTGGGELQVSRHSTQAHWSDPGAYIRVYLDDLVTCRGAFWVTQSNDEILGADEDGIEVYRRQGNGALYYLSDAIVWYEAVTTNDSAAPLDNTDVWEWAGPVHPGGILVRMIEEAIVRGCYPDLTYDFTRTTDSNGDPWTITIEEVFQLQVGTNMLEVVAKLQELGLVLVMDHDLVLHAYESVANASVGRDLSATVTLTKGADIVDSAERQQVSASARSTTLVKGIRSDSDDNEIAWAPADSAAALSELGRRKEGFLDAGDATHFDTLELMGLNDIYRHLRLKAGPTAISVTDPNADAKRALIDYTVGDTITVDIPGVFNAVAKPITSIQIREREAVRDALHEDTGYSDYDVIVGFDEDPARLDLPPDIAAGPAGTPDMGADCPFFTDDGPTVVNGVTLETMRMKDFGDGFYTEIRSSAGTNAGSDSGLFMVANEATFGTEFSLFTYDNDEASYASIDGEGEGGFIKILASSYIQLEVDGFAVDDDSKHFLYGGYGVVVPLLHTDPTSGQSEKGQVYYNDTDDKLRWYDGATWSDMGGATFSGNAVDVSITDAGNYYTGITVEAALQELGAGTLFFTAPNALTLELAGTYSAINGPGAGSGIYLGSGTGGDGADLSSGDYVALGANNYSAGGASTAKHYLYGGHGAVLPKLTADPSGANSEDGQTYYNTVTHKFRGRANGVWVDLN